MCKLCSKYKVVLGRLTLYTLHSTLGTLHFTHSTLPTLHFTLHTPHSTLSTPHLRLTGNRENMYILSSSDVFHACLCALVVSLWTVDQVPSLRRYARTMHGKKKVRFPTAEVFIRSPRTWIHSGSWLPSCLHFLNRFCALMNAIKRWYLRVFKKIENRDESETIPTPIEGEGGGAKTNLSNSTFCLETLG